MTVKELHRALDGYSDTTEVRLYDAVANLRRPITFIETTLGGTPVIHSDDRGNHDRLAEARRGRDLVTSHGEYLAAVSGDPVDDWSTRIAEGGKRAALELADEAGVEAVVDALFHWYAKGKAIPEFGDVELQVYASSTLHAGRTELWFYPGISKGLPGMVYMPMRIPDLTLTAQQVDALVRWEGPC